MSAVVFVPIVDRGFVSLARVRTDLMDAPELLWINQHRLLRHWCIRSGLERIRHASTGNHFDGSSCYN